MSVPSRIVDGTGTALSATVSNVDPRDGVHALAVDGLWDRLSKASLKRVGDVCVIYTNGRSVISISVEGNPSPWSGTLVFEATVDELSWFSILAFPVLAGSVGTTSTTMDGSWRAICSGFKLVRVRATVLAAATAVYVGMRASPSSLMGLSTDSQGSLRVVLVPAADALPLMLNPTYDQTVGAVVANSFARALSYTVPVGYSGYVIRYTSWQNESAFSRLVSETQMGTLDLNPNTFTSGNEYGTPTFAGVIEAEVTVQIGSTGATRTVTATYTNENGVGSRTGTFSIPKSSIIGSRFVLQLQAGDIGVRSIQNLSSDVTGDVGAILVYGFIQLAFHIDLSSTQATVTSYTPGAVAFPSGTVLGVEYKGGLVSKQRIFGALVQLISTL